MTEEKHSISEIAINTQLLYERLSKLKVGEIISYDELSAVISQDIRSCWHNLATARRRVLALEKIATECVRGEGVKRLSDVGIIGTFGADLRGIRRKAKKSRQRIVAIQDYDGLSEELKVQHNTSVSMLGAIEMFAKESSLKKLKGVVDYKAEKLSLADTLAAFSK